ncbi:hypothetical protein NEQG_01169 [Nematocida parisii ERTm3]|uniref:Uncharacterized protein n=1 Tax=Nematocida parisii (strain ERTm3) TaxID=935791 RepID=I3EGY2_NEMP3|nr:hypothetical protein NEQG_01169 [Nematocida parisii ERTm3]
MNPRIIAVLAVAIIGTIIIGGIWGFSRTSNETSKKPVKEKQSVIQKVLNNGNSKENAKASDSINYNGIKEIIDSISSEDSEAFNYSSYTTEGTTIENSCSTNSDNSENSDSSDRCINYDGPRIKYIPHGTPNNNQFDYTNTRESNIIRINTESIQLPYYGRIQPLIPKNVISFRSRMHVEDEEETEDEKLARLTKYQDIPDEYRLLDETTERVHEQNEKTIKMNTDTRCVVIPLSEISEPNVKCSLKISPSKTLVVYLKDQNADDSLGMSPIEPVIQPIDVTVNPTVDTTVLTEGTGNSTNISNANTENVNTTAITVIANIEENIFPQNPIIELPNLNNGVGQGIENNSTVTPGIGSKPADTTTNSTVKNNNSPEMATNEINSGSSLVSPGPTNTTNANGPTNAMGANDQIVFPGPTNATNANGPTNAMGANGLTNAIGANDQIAFPGPTNATNANDQIVFPGPTNATNANDLIVFPGPTNATNANGPTNAMGANGSTNAMGTSESTNAMGANGLTNAIGANDQIVFPGPTNATNANGPTNAMGSNNQIVFPGPTNAMGSDIPITIPTSNGPTVFYWPNNSNGMSTASDKPITTPSTSARVGMPTVVNHHLVIPTPNGSIDIPLGISNPEGLKHNVRISELTTEETKFIGNDVNILNLPNPGAQPAVSCSNSASALNTEESGNSSKETPNTKSELLRDIKHNDPIYDFWPVKYSNGSSPAGSTTGALNDPDDSNAVTVPGVVSIDELRFIYKQVHKYSPDHVDEYLDEYLAKNYPGSPETLKNLKASIKQEIQRIDDRNAMDPGIDLR